MIVIKNLNKERPVEPYQVRVDASSGSPLGNPFHYMISQEGETARNYCIDMYKKWFSNQLDTNPIVLQETQKLLDIYFEHDKLELFCWCSPRRCHAEVIREYLETQIEMTRIIRRTCETLVRGNKE